MLDMSHKHDSQPKHEIHHRYLLDLIKEFNYNSNITKLEVLALCRPLKSCREAGCNLATIQLRPQKSLRLHGSHNKPTMWAEIGLYSRFVRIRILCGDLRREITTAVGKSKYEF
jgi:hypothetical protein